jgi:hypothetical protein
VRTERHDGTSSSAGYEPKGALPSAHGMKYDADDTCVVIFLVALAVCVTLCFWRCSRLEGRLYWRPAGETKPRHHVGWSSSAKKTRSQVH